MIVSFAIVAYNEEKTLPRLLEDLCAQDYPHEEIEVLLIDSVSTDGTAALMEKFMQERQDFRQVLVLKNPQKTLPYGCNIALKNYTGDAIVRIDAHASIPNDFIRKNVETLERGENICGGQRPNIIDEATPWKMMLLTAEQSMFGSSIADYRHSKETRYVNSVFHGMYRREVYAAVGLYDERLARTEDNDMSYRIRSAGYQILYNPQIISYQHTRNSLSGMLRQKYLNGYWIGRTVGINPRCFSLYHFVPFCFVLGIILTTCLVALGYSVPAVLMWSAYLLLIFACTIVELINHPFAATKLLLPFVFLMLHASYGAGTLVGLVGMPFWIRKVMKT